LVGKWVLTPESPGYVAAKPTTIVIKADGSFDGSNYPWGELDLEPPDVPDHSDGTGTWSVEKYQWYWVVRLYWKNIGGSSKVEIGGLLHIVDDGKARTLRETVGDPDEGKGLRFVKE